MTETIKDKLDAEIESELDALKETPVDSETFKTTVDCVSKLIDKRNEMEKIELDKRKQDLSELAETNKNNKEKELNEYNKKDQFIKNAISIGSIVIPVFVTVWGTYKTLKFEETGTVTTIMGRGFINKLIPKK